MPIREFPVSRTPAALAVLEAYAASPQSWPSPPVRPAATVMLLREGPSGLEVFMQRRVASMEFAPRRHVFPGGGVDAGDAAADIPWVGPSAEEWAQVLAVPVDEARALVVAAIRELFEECGVLLASVPGVPSAGVAGDAEVVGSAGVVGGAGVGRVASLDPDALEAWRGSEWAAARRAIARRERSFAEFLRSAGLVARTDLLGYYARWVTPEIEPRRYDTHFFTAMMPTGQRADAATSEAQSAGWVVPAAMLAAATTGTALLMPPTVIALEAVAGATQAAELVGRRERVPLIRTIPARTPTGWVMQAVIP